MGGANSRSRATTRKNTEKDYEAGKWKEGLETVGSGIFSDPGVRRLKEPKDNEEVQGRSGFVGGHIIPDGLGKNLLSWICLENEET